MWKGASQSLVSLKAFPVFLKENMNYFLHHYSMLHRNML